MQNLRRISQGIFLVIFLFLFVQTESKGNDVLGYPAKIFLDFDPLILTTTVLSAHTAAKAFYLSLIMIVVTLLLGRVFCGWVCPQTVFMEMVFRKIEYWIEGDSKDQRKLKAAPWTASKFFKKTLKQIIFFTIAFFIFY